MALPQIPIGLELIVAVPGVLIFLLVFLVWFILDLKKLAPEAFVFRKCRKKDLAALEVEDIGSGHCRLIVGEKDKNGDPIFRHPDDPTQLVVDPTYLHNTKPRYWGNGLSIWHYASSQWQPMTTINALGLNTCKKVAKQYFPELLFMTDRDLMTFAKMRRDHLKHNVNAVIHKYQPEWDDDENTPITHDEVYNAVIEYQEALKKKTIDTGIVAWDAAFAMNPITHLVQDLAEIKVLIEMKVRSEFEKKLQWMQYGMIIAGIIGVTGIVIIGMMVFA
jgi:hypothetical protein